MTFATLSMPAPRPSFAPASVRACTVPALLAGLYLLMALWARHIWPDSEAGHGFGTFLVYVDYMWRNGQVALLFGSIAALLALSYVSRGTSIIGYIRERFMAVRSGIPGAAFGVAVGVLTFSVFMFSYSALKVRIPVWSDFTWDPAFAAWDRALFAGRDPWTLFAWIYDYPGFVGVMDWIYDAWAVLLCGAWLLAFARSQWSGRAALRLPVAIMMLWFMGGNVLATVFASAGPCYYALVTGVASDPFAAQLATLAAFDINAVSYQALLWQVHESPGYGLGGISALPSMHCGTSALFVLAVWRRPALRLVAAAFAVFIWIGSFMLAWHYAVDGLAALPVVALAWWAAGKLCHPSAASAPSSLASSAA